MDMTRKFLHYLFALCAVVVAMTPAYGYAHYAVIGTRAAADSMLVCDKKADAVTFVQTMHDKGFEAAEAFFKNAKGCGIAEGVFVVGNVQYVLGIEKIGLAKVVQIETEDGVKYWITTTQIIQHGERPT